MAKFLNKKEQVIDFKLTNYGHYLLSIGKMKPVYYAFFDDNVLYDGEYAGITGSQNSIHERIKDNTPYLEGLTHFTNIDAEIPTKQQSEMKKKRLMDKINKLSSAVTSCDGNRTQILDKITNGNDEK